MVNGRRVRAPGQEDSIYWLCAFRTDSRHHDRQRCGLEEAECHASGILPQMEFVEYNTVRAKSARRARAETGCDRSTR